VRDQALAASGLLVRELGGRSARTYQPAGLWAEIASAAYHQDHGRNLYRRSLYTFWKRTVPPPLMSTFDAPSREACILQRSRTNTPLQALALMNEVTFVEAARKLAERAMRETGDDQNAQLARIFLLITGRRPRPEESAILHRHFARQLSRFTADRQAAVAMLSAGESPRDETLAVAPLAALTATANLIMNLDEVVMRE